MLELEIASRNAAISFQLLCQEISRGRRRELLRQSVERLKEEKR